MEERILTLHPQSRPGVTISKAKYELVRQTILDIVRDYGEISLTDLLMTSEQVLMEKLKTSILWYVTAVQLDLEARGVLERVPESSPQKLRLKQV